MSGGSILCDPGQGPPMNTDISGIGVRFSFYLQTLFLACLSARSGSLEEIRGALYTLIATNMAMAVTAMILGLKPNPEISFQDALVVFYLLYLSWVTVCFSLPSLSRFSRNVKVLKALSILQSYAFFGFTLVLFIKAKTFGGAPRCNGNAVLVLFRPFPAVNAGRILCLVVACIGFMIYTFVTLKDYLPSPPKLAQLVTRKKIPRKPDIETEENDHGNRPPRETRFEHRQTHIHRRQVQKPVYELPIAWDLILELVVIHVIWALAVMNTELLIRWNHFNNSGSPPAWQFGQILPMFLVLLPFVNVVNAFQEFGLRPWQARKCDCAMIPLMPDVPLE